MKLLAIPNFGERISPRIDYAETLQLISIEGKSIIKRETIKILSHSNLEHVNLIIRLNPNVIICDGISNLSYNKLIENKIRVFPWVHGKVDEILEKYLKGKIEFESSCSKK